MRYADDILIFCRSRAGAENALVQATKILEKELRLTVNETKSHIARSHDGVKFLGVEIGSQYTRIQAKKLVEFKKKLKQMTKRNGGNPTSEVIKNLNPVLRGFSQYFRIANSSREYSKIAGWLRRRLRSIQLKLWKKPKRLHRRLKQLGYKPPFRFIRMNSWRNAQSPLASYAMPNQWFNELGLVKELIDLVVVEVFMRKKEAICGVSGEGLGAADKRNFCNGGVHGAGEQRNCSGCFRGGLHVAENICGGGGGGGGVIGVGKEGTVVVVVKVLVLRKEENKKEEKKKMMAKRREKDDG